MNEFTLKNKLVGVSDTALLPLVELTSSEIWHFHISLSDLNQLRNIPVPNKDEIATDIDRLFSDGLFAIHQRIEELSGKKIKYDYDPIKLRRVLSSAELYNQYQLSDDERNEGVKRILRNFTRTELMSEIAKTLTELAILINKYFNQTIPANSRNPDSESLYWPIVNYLKQMFKNILKLDVLACMPGTKRFGDLKIPSEFVEIICRQVHILRSSTSPHSRLVLADGDIKTIHEVLGMPIFSPVLKAEKTLGYQLDVTQNVPRLFADQVEKNIEAYAGTSDGRQFLAMAAKCLHQILDEAAKVCKKRWSAWEALKDAEMRCATAKEVRESREIATQKTRYQQLLKVYQCLFLTCLSIVATGFLINLAKEENIEEPPF